MVQTIVVTYDAKSRKKTVRHATPAEIREQKRETIPGLKENRRKRQEDVDRLEAKLALAKQDVEDYDNEIEEYEKATQ